MKGVQRQSVACLADLHEDALWRRIRDDGELHVTLRLRRLPPKHHLQENKTKNAKRYEIKPRTMKKKTNRD